MMRRVPYATADRYLFECRSWDTHTDMIPARSARVPNADEQEDDRGDDRESDD